MSDCDRWIDGWMDGMHTLTHRHSLTVTHSFVRSLRSLRSFVRFRSLSFASFVHCVVALRCIALIFQFSLHCRTHI